MLPNSFSRGVAEYPFCTLVPTRDDAIEILANDGIIRGGHNGSQQTRYFFWLLRVAHIVGCLWSQIPDNVLALSAKFHLCLNGVPSSRRPWWSRRGVST